MSDEDLGEESTLTAEEGLAGLEAVREQILSGGGAMAYAAKLNEGNLELSGLDAKTYTLVRIAAAAAMNAPKVAWDFYLEVAEELGLESEDVLGVLVAVTPIIGTARMLQAVTHIVDD